MGSLDITDENWLREIIEAINGERIHIAVQGIHSVAGKGQVLYGECLARLVERDGQVKGAEEFVPVLDIWGKMPLLDQYMLKHVLDQLEANPRVVLGCNISTDSFSRKHWDPIYRQLTARRHLASRLVLEITETRPLLEVQTTQDCIDAARRLGCLVAIDDFGSGLISIWQLLKLHVDIVKIDASCAHDIKHYKPDDKSLYRMVALARGVAQTIVVEYIENDVHLAEAVEAGATHVQGFYLSLPEILHYKKPVIRPYSEAATLH